MGIGRKAAFKHGHVVTGIRLRKPQISAARGLECGQRGGFAVEGGLHRLAKNRVTLQGGLGDQFFTALKMAIHGGRGHARILGRLGQGETCRAFFGDQPQSGLNQGLTQIAVMIALFTHCPLDLSKPQARHLWQDRGRTQGWGLFLDTHTG